MPVSLPLAEGSRTALYLRQSRDATGERAGVDRQTNECQALAAAKGWTLVRTYEDNDVSASGKVKRPGYLALVDAISAGEVNALIVWHPDRLHRSPAELEGFIDLVERERTAIATVSAGVYDLTTPAGRMTARVVGAMARYEGEQKAARQRSRNVQDAQAGRPWLSKDRCYGYTKACDAIVPEEAAWLRAAAERVLGGASVRSTCVWLNEQGVRTTNGNEWAYDRLSAALKNERYAALRYLHGETYEGNWPALWDTSYHERLVEALEIRTTGHSNQARTTLAGSFAFCALCGNRLRSSSTKAKPRVRNPNAPEREYYYSCLAGPGLKGCGKVTIMRHQLDGFLKDTAIAALVDLKRDTSPTAVEADVDALEDRLASLEDAYWLRGDMTPERYETITAQLRASILEARTATLSAGLPALLEGCTLTTTSLSDAWESKPLEWQRAVVGSTIAKCLVHKPAKAGRGSKAVDRTTVHLLS